MRAAPLLATAAPPEPPPAPREVPPRAAARARAPHPPAVRVPRRRQPLLWNGLPGRQRYPAFPFTGRGKDTRFRR